MRDSQAIFFLLRFFVYAALIAGTFEWVVLSAGNHDVHWLMRDDGPVEVTQLLAAFFTAVLYWLLSRRSRYSRELFQFLSALSFTSCARELDNFTLELGSRAGYLLMAALPVAWGVSVFVRARERLFAQLSAFSRTPGFSLSLAGFLIVVVYAQILGQKALWMAVLSLDVYRPVKELVEESSELLGYLLILFGAAEAMVNDRGEGSAKDREMFRE
jgi:hypothetical protein